VTEQKFSEDKGCDQVIKKYIMKKETERVWEIVTASFVILGGSLAGRHRAKDLSKKEKRSKGKGSSAGHAALPEGRALYLWRADD